MFSLANAPGKESLCMPDPSLTIIRRYTVSRRDTSLYGCHIHYRALQISWTLFAQCQALFDNVSVKWNREISIILSPTKTQYSVVKADLKIGMRCEQLHVHRRLCELFWIMWGIDSSSGLLIKGKCVSMVISLW